MDDNDLFWLFWRDSRMGEVRAPYASLEEATAQGRHDLAIVGSGNDPGAKLPLRIEHPLGTKVWDARKAKPQDGRLLPGRPEYEVQLKTEAARKAG